MIWIILGGLVVAWIVFMVIICVFIKRELDESKAVNEYYEKIMAQYDELDKIREEYNNGKSGQN